MKAADCLCWVNSAKLALSLPSKGPHWLRAHLALALELARTVAETFPAQGRMVMIIDYLARRECSRLNLFLTGSMCFNC